MCFPNPEAVLASGGKLKLANWDSHRDHACYGGQPYAHYEEYADKQDLTRVTVFADFDVSIRKGIISAIKWGYPSGAVRRNWKGLSHAFRSDGLVREIEAMRNEPACSALEIAKRLNRAVKGISTATTTKLAYFARLEAAEGPCLIYDSMVRRAISARCDPEFADLKRIIGSRSGDLLPGQHATTYAAYLKAARAMAEGQNVQGDQIELFLFIGRENAAALPPYPWLR